MVNIEAWLSEFKWLADLLAQKESDRISDFHMHIGAAVRLRVDGDLKPWGEGVITEQSIDALLNLFGVADWETKLQLERGIKASGTFLEKRWRLQVAYKEPHGLVERVAGETTRRSPWVVMRKLSNDIPSFEQLGLRESIKSLLESPRGLGLIVGSVGSGKSTSLAAIVDDLNENGSHHIITIEDPIEYLHQPKKSWVTSIQVGRDVETYAEGLKAALRQDPDVILVGEIRDLETMEVALQASETGHMVLGTLHADSTTGAIERVAGFYPADAKEAVCHQMSSALRFVIAQRLVPKKEGGGRVLAHEIMTVTPAISAQIKNKKFLEIVGAIRNPSGDEDRSNLLLLNDHLVELSKRGLISGKSALREAYDQADLRSKMTEAGLSVDD